MVFRHNSFLKLVCYNKKKIDSRFVVKTFWVALDKIIHTELLGEAVVKVSKEILGYGSN